MKMLFVILSALLSSCVLAQDADSTVVFYDEEGETTVDLEDAFSYRIIIPRKELSYIRHFYAANDQPIFEGTFRRHGATMIKEGPYKSWYDNGKMETEGSYVRGHKEGLWKLYYFNGQQSDEQFYHDDKIKYYQHWDEDGGSTLVNGNGKFTAGIQHVEVIDSLVFSIFSIDSLTRDSVYVVVPENAEYKGGMQKFYDDIEKDLKYPKLAREYLTQGIVYVELTIDKSGKLFRTKVKQSIGAGCDEAALKAVEKRTSWTPAKLRGKPVIQKMVLPIAFTLK